MSVLTIVCQFGLALWKTDAEKVLRNLDPCSTLPDQLKEQLQSVKKHVPKATNSTKSIELVRDDEPRRQIKDIEEVYAITLLHFRLPFMSL